jgi:hypothetical protein
MKDNMFMNTIGIVIAVGVGILLMPLLPLVVLGYFILKMKATNSRLKNNS